MTIRNLATHPCRFVTVPELIRYSGIPRATVYWHIYYGKLPARRFGAALRIETLAAREWVELYAREMPAPPPPAATAGLVSSTTSPH